MFLRFAVCLLFLLSFFLLGSSVFFFFSVFPFFSCCFLLQLPPVRWELLDSMSAGPPLPLPLDLNRLKIITIIKNWTGRSAISQHVMYCKMFSTEASQVCWDLKDPCLGLVFFPPSQVFCFVIFFILLVVLFVSTWQCCYDSAMV